ncbi:FG-GAP repeat protein [Variibacter gotjawalensis]|uniref:FG-GAP repeat protein n=1 Tax=Variibacter gotjawalensis TaxID=1333996 RepID=A0A0S3PYX2_9BRAD|nr:FG-GAP-like repeat-containing protein [Variibacter gotjawalensis]NIK46813.1 hypothetical protein [Variibacter gotjawalensis]RZS48717.1 cysteine-rich secretory family protein [Variibacter gotjawalensis]BAT60976.1 FG-GAP repeat protein [Variibacter gotjawalensis]
MTVNIYAPTASDDLSSAELELYNGIMAYRAQNGLPPIQLSKALTTTAGRHATDTVENIWGPKLQLPAGANMHSWSDAPYFGDHSQPQAMWDAPQRLGTGYPGRGYEISASGQSSVLEALKSWQNSPSHNDVVLNKSIWGADWKSIGIGVEQTPQGNIYHVWFGHEADPTGGPNIVGGAGADNLTGSTFDDIFFGKGGDDVIDGAGGIDTVNFSGAQSDYKVTLLGNNSATIQDIRPGAADGIDTIKNVEFVQFAGKKVAFADLQTTQAPKAGAVTIGDMSIEEGNSGTKTVTFTVTRTGGDAAFSVKYATQDDSAKAGSDYVAKTDTLNFGVGEMKKTFTIVINGDTVVESPEKFFVNLSNATNGATIADSQAVGNILNDDVAAPVNTAPVVTGKNVAVDTHGSVAISSLFTATDKDGNGTIKQYAFWDSGDSDGFISVNGVAQASDKWIFVNATDLANVKYVGGAATGAEKIFVTAFDGTAWSANASLTATTTARADNDFGGDGKSDLLFVNNKTGSVALWQMDGTKLVANETVGKIGTTWKAIGTDDFGGDGKADVLWQNSNGSVAMWQMDGNKIVANETVGKIGSNWKAAAIDDFNGDGKADVLWTSTTGSVALWQMDGSKIAANQTVGTLGANWLVQDAGDFNGDGKADILLRNSSTGSVAMWQMDGNKIVANQTVGTIGTAWKFAGAADFNGDGNDDILWRNDNGSVAMWQMDGNKIIANETVGKIAANWTLADIGDFNNDGKADIMWQNDKGSIAEWQMNGSQIAANQTVHTIGPDWHIV